MKNHFRNLHAPLCGIFHPNSVAVARYGALIRAKSPTNCDAHLAESLFQTRSKIFSEPPQSPQTRHATSTHVAGGRKSKNLTNLHSPPRWILIFQCPIHKFSKPKGIPFHTKQMPSFRMSSLLRDRKSTRLNSSHPLSSRMPSSA